MDTSTRAGCRPHCSVMTAPDFNRRQLIFMSFCVILSNTARLVPFPCGDTRVQGSAKAWRVPAMIAQTHLQDLSRPSTRTHSSCAWTANNEAGENAFTLNSFIAPCINEYWLSSWKNNNNSCIYNAHISIQRGCSKRNVLLLPSVVGYNFKTALTVHNFHSQGSIPCRAAYRGVTGKYIHNISFTSYRVPIYTPGWRAAMWIKCLAEGQKCQALTGIEPATPWSRVEGSLQYTTAPPRKGRVHYLPKLQAQHAFCNLVLSLYVCGWMTCKILPSPRLCW